MVNMSVNVRSYGATTEEILGDFLFNKATAKSVESTKIPDAFNMAKYCFEEKVDLKEPDKNVDQAQLKEECDGMLDSLAKVIGELQKLMSKQREMNTQLIVSNLQQAKQENLNAAKDMMSKAGWALATQMLGAVISITASAVSLGYSVKAFGKQIKIESKATEAAKDKTSDFLKEQALEVAKTENSQKTKEVIEEDAKKIFENFSEKDRNNAYNQVYENSKKVIDGEIQKQSAIAKAYDSIGGALKGVCESVANTISTSSQASVKESDAKVQELQSLIERLKEINESVKDVQRKSLETLSTVSQAEVDALRKLAV